MRSLFRLLTVTTIVFAGCNSDDSPLESVSSASVVFNETCPDGGGGLTVYEVGMPVDGSDNRTEVPTIGDVPWETIVSNTTVCIYPKSDGTPYAELILINRPSQALTGLTIRGIPTAVGPRPKISAAGATCGTEANPSDPFTNDDGGAIVLRGAPLNKIDGITVENLEISGARKANSKASTCHLGESYSQDAGAVYTQDVKNLVVRNNILRDSAMGINTSGNDETITIEGNYFVNNGFYDGGPDQVHHAYVEGKSATVRHNYFGELCSASSPGCAPGAGTTNSLKMRTVPATVAYNWFEGGSNYAIDIIEPEKGSVAECEDFGVGGPLDVKDVYGNVITRPDSAYSQSGIVHFGGEGGCADLGVYRKTLNFYNNTVTSHKTGQRGLKIGSPTAVVDVWNTIFSGINGGSISEVSSTPGSGATQTMSYSIYPSSALGSMGDGGNNDTCTVTFLNPTIAGRLSSADTCAQNQGAPSGTKPYPDQEILEFSKERFRPVSGAVDIGALEVPAFNAFSLGTTKFVSGGIGIYKVTHEAEAWDANYRLDTGPSLSGTEDRWRLNTTTSIRAGGDDAEGDSCALVSCPRVDYQVRVNTSADYTIWLRALAQTNGDDRVWVGKNRDPSTAVLMETTTYGAWHWTNRRQTGAIAKLPLSAGYATISIWMADDGYALDEFQLVYGRSSPSGVVAADPQYGFLQSSSGDNNLMIEVERYHFVGGADQYWDTTWDPPSGSGFVGSAFKALPDLGLSKYWNYQSSQTVMNFYAKFVTAGRHYVWVRGLPAGTGGDLVHVSLGSSGFAYTHDRASVRLTPGSTFQWSRTAEFTADDESNPAAWIDIPHSGDHRLTVTIGDDGAAVDAILLTKSSTLDPNITGVPESALE